MMKKELINLKEFFKDSNEINNCLKKVEDEYRPNSAANYLYNLILKEYIDNKYIDNKYINKENGCYEEYFIDLIWATLDAWNMNSRSAKLAGIEVFRDNLKDNTEAIERLKKYSIEDLSEKNDKSKGIFEQLKTLFNKLKLTDTDTKLVTFSKTMHFLLPNLIVPIDRTYTEKFFKLNFNNHKYEEFDHFTNIESAFGLFASEVNLDDFVRKNSKWCKYKTKIIDNIIIGYVKIVKIEQNNIFEFWSKFDTVLEEKNFPFKMGKAKNYQRYQVELGTTQYAINIELVNSDHRIRSDHKIRVNVNIQKNNDLYDFFFEHKSEIESKLGYELTWDRKDDKSSSICTYIDGLDYDNKSNYQNLMEQIITKTREIIAVFSDLIQSYKNNEVEPK